LMIWWRAALPIRYSVIPGLRSNPNLVWMRTVN
jgi:hypothetical protein